MKVCLAVFVMLLVPAAQAADVKGKVVSATDGEPLRQVRVSVLENKVSTVTADNGTFSIPDLSPGKYTLQVAAVGYRLVNAPFEITADGAGKDFSITLVPDNLRRTEVVEVHGDVFQNDVAPVPSQMTLNARELKEASTAVANDPFRAVQALPGVSASDNNEFFGQFSVMGAPFASVAIYVDNVVTPSPFNSVGLFRDGASLSVFSSETIQELNLMPVAYPVRFADAQGAALAITTREGSRTRPHFAVTVGMAESEVVGEGALGSLGKGSWLASARRSYLNYLYRARGGDPSTDVGFEDGSVKLNYDLARNHSVSLYFLAGHTDLDQTVAQPGANSLISGGNDFHLARVGWRYAASPRLLFDSEGAYIRQSFDTRNPANQILDKDYYGEWVGGSRAVWNWHKDHVLEAGYTGRRLKDSSISNVFFNGGTTSGLATDATGWRQNGYVQQNSSFFDSRLRVMAGMRWDRIAHVDFQPITAQASAAWQLASRTQVQFGFGRYTQFPDFHTIGFDCRVSSGPLPQSFGTVMLERSDHYSAALEQRVGENIRVRVEGFDRQNQFRLGSFAANPGKCGQIEPVQQFPHAFDLDHSRGMQIMVQRRSANRLSGWVGYTLAYASVHTPFTGSLVDNTGPGFDQPTLTDQRHTLNAFGMYRVTPSINLSAKVLYGSGFPFFTQNVQFVGSQFILSPATHNRIGPYERLDVRFDKAWAFKQWKMTLYAEGLNMTNHDNLRLLGSTFDLTTGNSIPITAHGLPITPTVGVTFDF